MDPRIEILKKNYDERMNEYVNVLNRSDCLPGCKVLDEWRFYLELSLKVSGWVAVYKPSKERQPCPGLDLINELVLVEKVVYHNFEAIVLGLEKNDGTSSMSDSSSMTSKTFCVALEDLYSCINQINPDIDGVEINNILDKLRFFKQNLWLPWDEEEDSEDWRVTALEPRMQLLYDIEQGQVSCEVAERARRLFGQAWRAYEKLRTLELAMDEVGETGSVESQAQDEEEGVVIRMMHFHRRIDDIKKEYERLQNPLIRNLMIREKQRALKKSRSIGQPWLRLVWSGGNIDNLKSHLEEAVALGNAKDRFKVYPLLQMALEEAIPGDMLVLIPSNPSQYTLLGSGGLEEGGTIRGLGTENVCISGCESGDVMLSLHCNPVERSLEEEDIESSYDFLLKNVTLDARNLEICLLVNSGHVRLENCKIDGGGSHTSDSIGIMVRSCAKLVAQNCIFSGFCSGIMAYDGSQLEFTNCRIYDCEIGMQLFRGVKVTMEQCLISKCSKSGVMYKWKGSKDDRTDMVVTHDVLNSLPGINVNNTDFQAVQVILQSPNADNDEPDTSTAAFL